MTTIDGHTVRADRPGDYRFDPASLALLPEPARRWLTHAIAPGTSPVGSVELAMQGEIKMGQWHPFRASQLLAPPSSYVWAAQTRVFGIRVAGYDRYLDGAGEMRWRLLSVVPVMSARGADVSRSAAGRLAGESVLVPTTLLDADWYGGDSTDTAVFRRRIGGFDFDVQIRVAASGRLRSVTYSRWGNPDGGGFRECPFTVVAEDEAGFGGLTIMRSLRASWGPESDPAPGEFFRARIGTATFRQRHPMESR
jgi:hypothetical protein